MRVGLVGPGRRRDGLGPFLAKHLAAAGAQVVAVSGRDLARTQADAAELARALGHPVAAFASVDQLLAGGNLAALAIATPIAAHREALQAAAAAGVPTLCEKPLVDLGDHAAGLAAVDAFARASVPLVENCQWPYALRALRAHAPLPARAHTFAQRLSPSGVGRSMVLDSLSHFLSLLQEVAAIDAASQLEDLRYSSGDPAATELTLSGALRAASGVVEFRLELVQCPAQPRPAWFALDGVRCTRELLLPQYHWQFAVADRRHSVGDPQAALVYHFVQLASEPRSESNLDVVRSLSAAIRTRARLFREILAAYPG